MSDDPTPKHDDPAPDERSTEAKALWGAPHQGSPPPASGATPAAAEPAAAEAARPASIYTTLNGAPIAPGTPFGSPTKGGSSPFGKPPKRNQSPLWSGQVTPPSAVPSATDTSGRPHYVLSGWWARAGAVLLDNLLFGAIALAAAVAAGVALGLTVDESFAFFGRSEPLPENIRNEDPFLAVMGGRVVLQLSLLVWFFYKGRGQTPGKRVAGVRVVRADGQPFTLRLAFKREVLVKTLPVVVLVGVAGAAGLLLALLLLLTNYLWPLWDPQRRALHDIVVGTRVVTEPKD